MSNEAFRILFVCTGNLCRSPMAERLLQVSLSRRLGLAAIPFTAVSAGTHAQSGAPMHPYAAQALAELGADAEAFQSRPLIPADVASADLVLTATRAHRARCVQLHPATVLRCFTLRQWNRLVGAVEIAALPAGDPLVRARSLHREVLAVRGTVQPVPADLDDLPDPLHRPAHVFRACADELAGFAWRTSGLIASS
jgi:protein-tyrosine phosphatase